MDTKKYNKELKLLVSEEIKEALLERSRQDMRSMNGEANYLLAVALGLADE